MIARLSGQLVATEADAVIVDVSGIGYRVHVPLPVLAAAGGIGDSIALHTYLHVRENELSLYGAIDRAAIDAFRLLLAVSGVGPKVAMAMLSTFEPSVLQRAIAGEDVALLTRVPGVGRKLAQRIVLELKNRPELAGAGAGDARLGPVDEADRDAQAALVALGYSVVEAQRALAGARSLPGDSTEQRIVAALRFKGGG